mgnify:FL=1
MEDVYMSAIIVFLIIFVVFTYSVCMSGYTTKRKNPDDYQEINERQKQKDIETIKVQDDYDNKWGIIK